MARNPGSNRSFSSADISEAAEFLSLPVYMPEDMIHNQEDDSDAIEKFGTTDLLAGWRELLKKKSSDYSIWLKKTKLFQQKVINMKQSLQKDVFKVTQSLGLQAKQLNDELVRIPCSTREADDFIAFYEALMWVTDLSEVCTVNDPWIYFRTLITTS